MTTPRPVHTAIGWYRTDADTIERSADDRVWETVWNQTFANQTAIDIWELAPYFSGVIAVGRVLIDHGAAPSDQFAFAAVSRDGTTWIQSTGWPDLQRGYMTGVASGADMVIAYGRGGAVPADYDQMGNPLLPYVWVSPP